MDNMEQELIDKIPELTDLILPWLAILISVVLFMWFKDYALQISKGMKFKLDPHFQEGDEVFLEDQPAVIVKIGLSSTVFGIVNGRGYIWRFVPNESIFDMKLEKIVSDKIHYDSEAEEARKLKKLLNIEQEQDKKIAENKFRDVEQDVELEQNLIRDLQHDRLLAEHSKAISQISSLVQSHGSEELKDAAEDLIKDLTNKA